MDVTTSRCDHSDGVYKYTAGGEEKAIKDDTMFICECEFRIVAYFFKYNLVFEKYFLFQILPMMMVVKQWRRIKRTKKKYFAEPCMLELAVQS